MKRILSLLLTLTLLLAGCTPAAETPVPTPMETPAEERVVRYGLSNAWDSLMPYNSPSGSNYSRIIYDKLYDRLAYVHAWTAPWMPVRPCPGRAPMEAMPRCFA